MTDLLVAGLMVFGAAFGLLGAIGVLRFPDVYCRMQATSKAMTLGAGLTLVGAAVAFAEAEPSTKAILVLLFLFITQPIAAHMVSRAAYVSGVRPWEGTQADDLEGALDPVSHRLPASGEPSE